MSDKLALLNAQYKAKQEALRAAQEDLKLHQEELIKAHQEVFDASKMNISEEKMKAIVDNVIKQPYNKKPTNNGHAGET